jgi:hypothetical protein
MLLVILLTTVVYFVVVFSTRELSLATSFAALTLFVTAISTCTVIKRGDEKYAVRDTTNIQSAVTGSRIEGDFVLGTGSVEGQRYYAYWTTRGTHREGAVERGVVRESNWDVEIIETDTADSKIIFTEYKKEETPWRTWVDSPYQRAEIFVPEGSIRYNYKINAK